MPCATTAYTFWTSQLPKVLRTRHFIRKFTGKMPRPRLSPERGHTFCASLRSRNAPSTWHKRHQKSYLKLKFARKMPRPRLSQHADTHFVRACAVEMHFSNISQETSEEPLYTEIYRKNAAPQLEPRTQTHILCEPAQSKRMARFHNKSHFIRK